MVVWIVIAFYLLETENGDAGFRVCQCDLDHDSRLCVITVGFELCDSAKVKEYFEQAVVHGLAKIECVSWLLLWGFDEFESWCDC